MRLGPFSRSTDRDWVDERRRMVDRQIRRRRVEDETVLRAMETVPRHLFVQDDQVDLSYADRALPIGHGQTISQPYIVARMTELLEPRPGLKVLEVGTGSGYQAAVLAACGMNVYSVERIPALQERARHALEESGFSESISLRLADGTLGWPEEAPFDRIIVTAGAKDLPRSLLDQLADGGTLVAPVGGTYTQRLRRYRREGADVSEEDFEAARFVPLVTEDRERD